MPDPTVANHLVGHEPGGIGHRLHAHGHDAVQFLHSVDDRLGFVDGTGHRFFAINILAGLGGFDGHFGVPVIGRGDADHVDFLQIEQFAEVFGDVSGVVRFKSAFFGGGIKPSAAVTLHFLVAVPDVADGDRFDTLLLVA